MTTRLLPPQNVDLDPGDFIVWERSFLVHPCDAFEWGMYPCGHASNFGARGRCTGCDEEVEQIHLCEHHLKTYLAGHMAMHLTPCGYSGFKIALSGIHPLE